MSSYAGGREWVEPPAPSQCLSSSDLQDLQGIKQGVSGGMNLKDKSA